MLLGFPASSLLTCALGQPRQGKGLPFFSAPSPSPSVVASVRSGESVPNFPQQSSGHREEAAGRAVLLASWPAARPRSCESDTFTSPTPQTGPYSGTACSPAYPLAREMGQGLCHPGGQLLSISGRLCAPPGDAARSHRGRWALGDPSLPPAVPSPRDELYSCVLSVLVILLCPLEKGPSLRSLPQASGSRPGQNWH